MSATGTSAQACKSGCIHLEPHALSECQTSDEYRRMMAPYLCESDMYDAARDATDNVLGHGTYAQVNRDHPDAGVQRAIGRGYKDDAPEQCEVKNISHTTQCPNAPQWLLSGKPGKLAYVCSDCLMWSLRILPNPVYVWWVG